MSRRVAVVAVAILALIGFVTAGAFYSRSSERSEAPATVLAASSLVRVHSPILGPQNAPVTIVEFFDPSCEACRAMYPVVKQIMAQHPKDVRLVLRYAPLHQGSESAIRLLEAARVQGKFEPVLGAVLASQPEWHDDASAAKAWDAAAAAGLNVEQARQTMMSPQITASINQDIADMQAANVRGTPTFFVNGKPLPSFGPDQLNELVAVEVAAAQ